MSDLTQASKVLPFCSILYRKSKWTEEELMELLPLHSCDYLFEHSHSSMHDYYEKEMGEGLGRFFVFGGTAICRDELINLKIKCDALEKEYSNQGRSFNFDPGILALEQVVLATGKPYSHRPYLGSGVYAELTYAWEAGQWGPFPWCYPDYRDPSALEYFGLMRTVLKNQLST